MGFLTNPLQAVTAQAGNGANGNIRMEARSTVQVQGTTTPTYQPQQDLDPLNDVDALTGSRSKWMRPASTNLPVYLHYELLVEVDGLPVLYSDDPTISPLAANDPAGIVMLRLQGAQTNAMTGNAIPGTEGPWCTKIAGFDSLNTDRAQAVRFDIVMNKSSVTTLKVLEWRLTWR